MNSPISQLFTCALFLLIVTTFTNGQNITIKQNATIGHNITTPVEVTEPQISVSNATVSEAGGKTKRTCACDDNTESLLCASNGITYKSQCRFQCAKARVSRLRIVGQGQCSPSSGAGSYWQKGFKG